MPFEAMLDLGVPSGVVFFNINPQNIIGVKYKIYKILCDKTSKKRQYEDLGAFGGMVSEQCDYLFKFQVKTIISELIFEQIGLTTILDLQNNPRLQTFVFGDIFVSVQSICVFIVIMKVVACIGSLAWDR
jgi:hypothetical protein